MNNNQIGEGLDNALDLLDKGISEIDTDEETNGTDSDGNNFVSNWEYDFSLAAEESLKLNTTIKADNSFVELEKFDDAEFETHFSNNGTQKNQECPTIATVYENVKNNNNPDLTNLNSDCEGSSKVNRPVATEKDTTWSVVMCIFIPAIIAAVTVVLALFL